MGSSPVTLLNIEFNSSCNLRCRWCSLDHDKQRQVMERSLLAKVMEQLVASDVVRLARIDLHNAGETLLHPDLPGMLTEIRRARPNLPGNPRVQLLTNVMLLTPHKAEQIVRSRAVDVMRFSLDGGTRELFESIRIGAKWDVVRRNVETFLQINAAAGAPIKTEAICILPPESPTAPTTARLDPDFRHLLERLDKVSLRHPHNWDGSADLGVDDASYRAIATRMEGRCCFLLERNLVVLPDGNVTVCCNDLNARGVIGSIQEHGVDALAMSPKRQQMMELFRTGNKAAIELCKDCSGFFGPPRKD